MTFEPPHPLAPLAETAARLAVEAFGHRPRIAPLRGGAGAGGDRHREWSALLGRFVRDGRVEYATMTRVRRLVEVYLTHLAEQTPDTWADADEQLAFFLNAYNTIAVHQVLLHYPVPSLGAIAGAQSRSYPIGRRNLSLIALQAGVLRAFGDPRVHAAITPAALGAPALQPIAYSGAALQEQLDSAVRALLADEQRGTGYDAVSDVLWLPAALRRYAGDWLHPERMPSLAVLPAHRLRPQAVLAALAPYLPAGITAAIGPRTKLCFGSFDPTLNDAVPVASIRPIKAV